MINRLKIAILSLCASGPLCSPRRSSPRRSLALAGLCAFAPLCLCASLSHASTGCGTSANFTIDNRDNSGSLSGQVVGLSAQGQPQGPLVGATVSVSGVGDTTTDSQGEFSFSNLFGGTYTVTAGKAGYLSVTRNVTLAAGETKYETFQLTALLAVNLDEDRDVDQYDFAIFKSCFSKATVPHDGSAICHQADFDGDGDVDMEDFGVLQRCYSGSGIPADPNCE